MKRAWYVMVLALLLLSACRSAPDVAEQSSQPDTGPATSTETAQTGDAAQSEPGDTEQLAEKPYGSFSIPAGWYEEEALSGEGVAFYVKSGTPLDSPTSNISVSEGENNYADGEHMAFAQAIDRQLRPQVAASGGSYTGGGSYTEQGYPLVVMNIEADGLTTIQYYIVGDYRFVMVHATDFGDDNVPDLEEAALTMVNSFLWAD